jgi:hypothetical protein
VAQHKKNHDCLACWVKALYKVVGKILICFAFIWGLFVAFYADWVWYAQSNFQPDLEKGQLFCQQPTNAILGDITQNTFLETILFVSNIGIVLASIVALVSLYEWADRNC